MNPDIEQACELLAAAQRDRRAFLVLRRDAESPLEATLFHAQQVLEKALKAALVRQGMVFRRTHDLVELNELAVASGLTVPVERSLMARLGPYAVEFRYLGVRAPEVALTEADGAVEAMLSWAEAVVA